MTKFDLNFRVFLKKYCYILIILCLFLWLYFYRLGGDVLENWDEAWYASIAQTMAHDGDVLTMHWLGGSFTDHPPLALWLMTLSIKILGSSEFAVRLPSALFGMGTMIMTYLLGIELFKKKEIGFVAALVLGTSLWYALRVRSGNFDSALVFFYVSTMFWAYKSSRKFTNFPYTMISFSALMLCKNLVGTAALIVILFWNAHHLMDLRKNWRYLLVGMLSFAIIWSPWYFYNYLHVDSFLYHHFVKIGIRSRSLNSFFDISYEQPLFYLFIGVRKWYKIWWVATIFLLISLKWLQKEVAGVLIWLVVVFYPFLTKDMTGIWHLLPVYPPLALITAYGIYELYRVLFSRIKYIGQSGFVGLYLVTFFVVGVIQIKNLVPDIIPTNYYEVPEVDVAKHAKDLVMPVYLDDEWLPVANFYADRIVYMLKFNPVESNTVGKMLETDMNVAIIARNDTVTQLDSMTVDYKSIYRNSDFSIIMRK